MSWVLKQVLPVNQFRVYTINGTDLYVANEDFAIRHWNMDSRTCVTIFRGHKGKVTDLEYSDEWKALFSTAVDGYLMIWFNGNLIASYLNKERRSDCFGSPLYSCTFNPRKDQLIVGAVGEVLVFEITWDLIQMNQDKQEIRSIKPISRVKLHTDVISHAICAGDKLITTSMDRTVGYSRLDSISVNKVLPLKQRQAICNLVYDAPEEIVYIGSIDGRIHAVTRDGLVLQSDTFGAYDCGVVSLAIDHSIGLIWAVMECGDIRLLDLHNFTTDLTDYFDTLRERPIIGVENHHFFGVKYDTKTKSMFAFCNDHYVFEFKFDDSAARVTFYTPSPMHSLTLVNYQGTNGLVSSRMNRRETTIKLLPVLGDQWKEGQYIIGGDKTMQIYLQQSRFKYDQVATTPSAPHTTCVDFSIRFLAYGNDKGSIFCVKLSNMQSSQTAIPLKGSITSIHLTSTHIIATTSNGNWDMLPLDIFPDPLEEAFGRELAHNGAINDSVFDPMTGTLITAGSDGLLKLWKLTENLLSKQFHHHKQTSIFMTENEQTMSETNVVDMMKFGEVMKIEWATAANRWVTAHSDMQIRVWTTDPMNSTLLITIPCGGCHITSLAVDDPDVILAAIDDRTIRCFSMENGELLRTMTGHKDIICHVVTNIDVDFYVSSSWDGAVKIWSKVEAKYKALSSSIYSTRRTESSTNRRRRPKTAAVVTKPKKNTIVYQPLTIYEKRKQEIERKRRKDKAEYDAKMRSPLAKELRAMAKLMLENM